MSTVTLAERIHFQLEEWRKNARKNKNRAWSGISILVMETEGAAPPLRIRVNYFLLLFLGLLGPGLIFLTFLQNFRSSSARPIIALENRKSLMESMILATSERQGLLLQISRQLELYRALSNEHQDFQQAPEKVEYEEKAGADEEIASRVLQLDRMKYELQHLLADAYYNLHFLWHRSVLHHNTPRGWPLKPGKGSITSTFGSREDPFGHKSGDRHSGMDFAASPGTPIIATAPGVVSTSSQGESGYGLHVWLHHGNGIRTLYAHCSEILVEEGQRVKRGDVIALVGSTGRSTGNHVHYEVKVGEGHSSDPYPYVLEK
ncbi:MAG: M23 family metallopeptidase [Spirochaetales bacterium]|nr:M23 family metallopeptidase [Spirochaetales bacterium]